MNYSELIDSLSSSYRNQLSKLTSSNPESPPGYLYKELVEYIKTDLSKLNDIEEYIINKLTRKEPYIKIKCLKLLKNLCTNFPNDFIRPKVTQSQSVLECKNYRAPPSEHNSEYLSKLVRGEFEELIKVVCSYESISNNRVEASESKMVGFGNNQYTNQSRNYQAPGYNNSNYQSPNTNYHTPNLNYGNPGPNYNPNAGYGQNGSRGVGGYGNSGMMGFGNPNMPRTQPTSTNSLTSFASNFTPTVSEIKNAGNNALKLITHAANKYIPSDIRDKIEKVGSAITSTATEQFEKYLGGRSPMGKSSSRNLNNSMYNSRGYSTNYQQGYGPSQPSVNYPPSGYNPSGFGSIDYKLQHQYGNQPAYNPHPFMNPSPATAQGFSSRQQSMSSTTFQNQQPLSHTSTYNQPFDPFPKQASAASSFSKSTSVATFVSNNEPTLDLFTTEDQAPKSKYTMPGERESAFVKEMLTFTGIKVSPSPRLIDEYLAKMKEMDKRIVVDELLKHLNTRSSKWQTHFRILCIFESLFQRGNLDEATVTDLKRTALPIFNKCKEEPQLSNKASKLLSMLSGLTGGLKTGEVSDLFSTSNNISGDKDLFSTQTSTFSTSTKTFNLVETKDEDPFGNKGEDLFSTNVATNPALIPVGSNMDEFDLFFSTTNSIQSTGRENRPAGTANPNVNMNTNVNTNAAMSMDVGVKQDQKHDLFDFDSLTFDHSSSRVKHESKGPQPSHEPIPSNIDNNLDLFDNTDFNADMLTNKPEDPFSQFQSTKMSSNSEGFELM